MRKPTTGEPCAGEPHARFGGRGARASLPLSTVVDFDRIRHQSVSPALLLEPAHHDPIERLGTFDIGEMAGVWNFLVTAAGYQPGEPPVLAGRSAGIVSAAHHQHRDTQRRELAGEIKIHD